MSRDPTVIDDKFWERLRYRGALLKQHVLGDLPESTAQLIGDATWHAFKRRCAADGNILPRLIAQLEPQDPAIGMYQRRGPRKPKGSTPFEDLPLVQRRKAEVIFGRLCQRWAGELPSWRRAILIGVARRLVLHPANSEWGRRMRRIKGGVHCQRKYRRQGSHPLSRFNRAMAKRQIEVRITETAGTAAEEAGERLGITSEQMRGVPRIAPLLEPIEGGIERVIEALRWSGDSDAVAFLAKYNSVPQTDLKHLSIDEICVAAGIGPRQLLSLALDRLFYICLNRAKIQIFSSLSRVMKATIKTALTDKGWRDRRLLLQMAGFLPIPKGWSIPFASF